MSNERDEAASAAPWIEPLRAFQACGIELEYALVGRRDRRRLRMTYDHLCAALDSGTVLN